MMIPDHISYICFDFDGVILDTIQLKEDAFVAAYYDIPTADEILIRDFQRNKGGGKPRNEKFNYFDTLFLNATPDETRLEMLSQRLSDCIMSGIKTCPHIPGFLEFLAKLQIEDKPLAIASAMPEDELHRIMDIKGIGESFSFAFGAPRAKSDQLIDIDRKLRGTGKGLYFGDTMSDHQAAHNAGLEFIGVGTIAPFKENNIPFIEDFTTMKPSEQKN